MDMTTNDDRAMDEATMQERTDCLFECLTHGPGADCAAPDVPLHGNHCGDPQPHRAHPWAGHPSGCAGTPT